LGEKMRKIREKKEREKVGMSEGKKCQGADGA
jgi:hypothetical protein